MDGRVVTERDHLYLKDYFLEEVQQHWRIANFEQERVTLVDAEGNEVTWTRAHDAALNPILLKVYETYVRMIHDIGRQAAYGIGQALGDVIVIYEDD